MDESRQAFDNWSHSIDRVYSRLPETFETWQAAVEWARQDERNIIVDRLYGARARLRMNGVTREECEKWVMLKFSVGSSGCGCLISDDDDLVSLCQFHADLAENIRKDERERLAKLAEVKSADMLNGINCRYKSAGLHADEIRSGAIDDN